MVFLGAVFSSIWITVANSWQQTPAGFHLVNGRAEITDFWAMVFNPSSVDRLIHVWLGAFSAGAFFVMSVTAYYILKGRHLETSKKAFTLALILGTFSSWAQLGSGHSQANVVARHQPAKLAAFEGHFKTEEKGTPLYIVGIPDPMKEKTLGLSVPGLLSFLIHNNFHTPIPGLDRFPREDWPPVQVTFQSYHLMVGLGFFMMGLTGLLVWLRWKGRLFTNRLVLWACVFSFLAPQAANQLGWVAAEVGRQPWIVYGLLRTADSLSPVVQAGQVLGSILMFGAIYSLLFAVWILVLGRKIQHGPEEA
jgi:cytochrome d ubiquinol oxidase subunit I